jgi:hypothetical protein
MIWVERVFAVNARPLEIHPVIHVRDQLKDGVREA